MLATYFQFTKNYYCRIPLQDHCFQYTLIFGPKDISWASTVGQLWSSEWRLECANEWIDAGYLGHCSSNFLGEDYCRMCSSHSKAVAAAFCGSIKCCFLGYVTKQLIWGDVDEDAVKGENAILLHLLFH